MKTLRLLLIFGVIFIFISCRENIMVFPGNQESLSQNQVNILLNSNPQGADVYLGADYTGKITPTNLELSPGSYIVTLSHREYRDTTFVLEVISGENRYISVQLH
jgi:hypothetical protein